MSDKTIEVTDTSLLERTNGKPPPEQDVAMRESIRRYVLEETGQEHHGLMQHLWERWEEWNEVFFGRAMTVPVLLINEPSNPRRLGDCGPVSGFGCSSQIRIRPSLLTGTHPAMRRGSRDPTGRRRFVEDILLHEMVHQWQQEVDGRSDESYHGHGPAFGEKANEIAVKLRLPECGYTCKTDRLKGKPSPSYWPANVRPDGYYLGVVRENTSCVSVSKDNGSAFVSVPTGDVGRAVELLRKHFDVDELRRRLKT